MAYVPNFRQPFLPYGNLIPKVTHSDSERPHMQTAAAAWLPISGTAVNQSMGFFAREERHQPGEYFVITPGKVVALTREVLGLDEFEGPVGRLVPAGVGIMWAAAAGGDDILEYTAQDVSWRIEDIATGEPVLAPVVYTKDDVTAALLRRGLLRVGESAEAFISAPVGVVGGAVRAWAGGDGIHPHQMRFHNHKLQDQQGVICDYALIYPHVPMSAVESRDIDAITSVATAAAQLTDSALAPAGAALWLRGDATTTDLQGLVGAPAMVRYGDTDNRDWVALALRTPGRVEFAPHLPMVWRDAGSADITSDVLVSEVESVAALSKDGDYFLDREHGILFMYEAGGDGLPSGVSDTDTIEFYAHAVHTDYVSDLPFVTGEVLPGGLLVCDGMSNLRPFVPRPAETDAGGSTAFVDPATYDRPESVLAQVLTFQRYPSEAMSKVKTWYDNLSTGILDAMPGSATGGFLWEQVNSGGGQYMVIVNLLK